MPLQLHVLNSINELRGLEAKWNDLWDRSDSKRPTARHECVIDWLYHFAPASKSRVLVVEQGNEFVAALPLVEARWMKVLPVGGLPRNDWYCAGTLLVANDHDSEESFKLITKGLHGLPWSIYRFPLIPSIESNWPRLKQASEAAGTEVYSRLVYDSAQTEICGDWRDYENSLSKGFRKQLSRAMRRMDSRGGWTVHRFAPTSIDEALPLLRRAFAIEDSGWKGANGSSILRTPGMQTLIERMGSHLTRCNALELAFLAFDGQYIAFELLWNSKGTLTSYKVGYDEQFKDLIPGHVLVYEILRDLYNTGRCNVYDHFGPITPAIERWGIRPYKVNQWSFAARKRWGKAVMLGYQQWVRRAERPRRVLQEVPVTNAPAGLDAVVS